MGSPILYGLGTEPSVWTPLRSVLEVASEASGTGNIIIHAGRESHGHGWTKSEHIVITPEQLPQLIADLSRHLPVDNGVPVIVKDGVVHCSECDSTEFKYAEGHPSERTMALNENSQLEFHGDFEWFDGDDDPGVVCEECGSVMDTSGIAVEFS